MNETNTVPAADRWDRIFRSLRTYDEETVVRFIRMVVSGETDLPAPEPEPC